jgi:carbon monoxide dehydrogenase subunit G
MVEIDHEIVIDAPPAAVFDYIADPHNHVKFTPSIVDVSDVTENDVGKQGAYTFKMVGVTMEGRFSDTAFERPTERSYDLTGDITGTVTWTVEEVEGRSRVRYESTVEFPGPDLLETVTEPVVRRFSEKEIESTLEQLQILVEEGRPTA